MSKRFHQHVPVHAQSGFALIELSIVIMLIGTLALSVFYMGRRLMQESSVHGTQQQMQSYVQAIHQFYDRYGSMPGHYSHAKIQIGVPNGSIQDCEQGLAPDGAGALAWQHLYAAGLIAKPDKITAQHVMYPGAKIGGGFSIVFRQRSAYLELGQERENTTRGPLLTRDEVSYLKRMFGDDLHTTPEEPGPKEKMSVQIFLRHY